MEGAQRLAQRRAAPAQEEQQGTLQRALEVSRLMGEISAELAFQQDSVQFIAEAAEESQLNVRRGNRELAQATERPSLLRDAVVTLLLGLTALLLFLDWFTP